ncbi:MAG: hypothetical protein ABI729_01015 [Chitinophagales bacterium]
MKTHIDIVPTWTRILVGVLALLNIAFGAMSYFDLTVLFHNSTGLDLANAAIKNASYEFAARNLAIGLALGIVAMKGIPESITIVIIIRALIEIQTIIVTIVSGNISSMLLMPVAFLAVEILIIKTMIGVIQKRDSQ